MPMDAPVFFMLDDETRLTFQAQFFLGNVLRPFPLFIGQAFPLLRIHAA